MQQTESLTEICVARCLACMTACMELAERLARGPADFHTAACVYRLLDCAQACEATLGFLGRTSPLQEEICALCGDVCETCAQKIELSGYGEAQVTACRECAEVCYEVWRNTNDVAVYRRSTASDGEIGVESVREIRTA